VLYAKKPQLSQPIEKSPDEEMLDMKMIESLKQSTRKIIYDEALNYQNSTDMERPREIEIEAEFVPYRFATRSNEVLQDGKPWRHDGGEVSFYISQAHDQLELYTPQGEFVKSYPVAADGSVTIPDLGKGVYLLYLRGRKISALSSTK